MTRSWSSIGFDSLLPSLASVAMAAIFVAVALNDATAQAAEPPGANHATPQAGPSANDEPLTAAAIDTLNNQFARLYAAGKLAEAEVVASRVQAAAERRYGADHIETATSLNNLARVLASQNRLNKAEALHWRALAIREKALPEGHPSIAVSLNNLANVVASQNRLIEAETLYRRALTISEKAWPEGHPDIATGLNNLADVLDSQNRLTEAEPLHRRALAIREKALPDSHPDIAQSVANLARLLTLQNRAAEAEPLHLRAIASYVKALPEGHPAIATSLGNLAAMLRSQNRLSEAEALERLSLAIYEKALPEGHPNIATSLDNLGFVLALQNRLTEAEPLNRQALVIREKALPEGHPDIAKSLENLGLTLARRGRTEEPKALLTASVAILTAPQNKTLIAGQNWRWYARQRIGLVMLSKRDGVPATYQVVEAHRTAFRDLQWERLGGTGGAIAAASARSQAADPEVGRLARERDRLLGELKRSDDRFLAVSSSTTLPQDERSRRMAELRTGSEALRRALEVADAEIGQRFPAYAELAEGRPLPVEELQPLLGPDEVLVSITPYDGGGFVFAYGREDGRVATLPQVGDVAALAARLRCSAALPDRTCAPGGPTAQPAPATAVAMAAGAAPGASAPAGAGAVRGPEEEALGRPDLAAGGAPFDLALAHDLYTRLFPEEIRAFVKGKRLILAPAPELLALPWHLLLTAPPPEGWDAPGTDRVALYKQAPWLFQSHPAITVLPTIASLRALRGNAVVRAPADRAFIGLGDPVIGRTRAERDAAPLDCAPAAAAAGPVQVAALRAPGSTENVFGDARGEDGFVLASVEAVRGQPRLPDSRCELIQIADTIAARQAQAEPGRDTAFPAVPRPARAGVDILLGPDASETRLKALNTSGELARYRILHFATHGLVSGELQLPEPALVLSPPAKASVQDDGLLTASEIATLTLAADWVVLSACNTAAGDAKGAEAFTGLAKAFFYAGAKSLLTSSWPVYSDAAVAITTLAFQNQHDGRAKALNHAMRDTLAAANSEHTAHPAYWAPFAIVGDGR
ncbi:tetratricopeptide repeat protein [Bosea sp. R86505]|uniref:CHAT domain-containing tetratricopeptide repeat protein n=1 Tax=Bosea sp. R86505 TaxID=3101710 RepID=UPI003672D521